jgi:hypothetical protein
MKTMHIKTSAELKFCLILFENNVLYSYRFIRKFGTHVVVGIKMGGKDIIYLKQQHSSTLQAVDVQKRLKEMSDRRFLDANGQSDFSFKDSYGKDKVIPQRLNFFCLLFSWHDFYSASVISINCCIFL